MFFFTSKKFLAFSYELASFSLSLSLYIYIYIYIYIYRERERERDVGSYENDVNLRKREYDSQPHIFFTYKIIYDSQHKITDDSYTKSYMIHIGKST